MMKVIFAISTIADGNMAISPDQANKSAVLNNRQVFLEKQGITLKNATRVTITYDGDNFCRYREVGRDNFGDGMFDGATQPADALVTTIPNHALFLPLADCIGAAIFDSRQNILMLSHIGRHSLEQFGAIASVKYLTQNYGSDPADLLIWLTGAPGKQHYPLFAFDNRSMKDVIFEQFRNAGVLDANIHDDPVDTTTDPRYFSHSEFLAGRQNDDGRYAVVAMMKP